MRGRISKEAERLREAFIELALVAETDDCIIWPYSVVTDGYPTFRGVLITRLICERIYGPPPTSKHEAAHNCPQSRACINKRHLRWDTHKGNQSDKISHGTSMRGELAPRVKLTEAQVREIRAKAGTATRQVIAKQYGIDASQVTLIINRKSWAWFT